MPRDFQSSKVRPLEQQTAAAALWIKCLEVVSLSLFQNLIICDGFEKYSDSEPNRRSWRWATSNRGVILGNSAKSKILGLGPLQIEGLSLANRSISRPKIENWRRATSNQGVILGNSDKSKILGLGPLQTEGSSLESQPKSMILGFGQTAIEGLSWSDGSHLSFDSFDD